MYVIVSSAKVMNLLIFGCRWAWFCFVLFLLLECHISVNANSFTTEEELKKTASDLHLFHVLGPLIDSQATKPSR